MKIEIAKTAGFCMGVRRAVQLTFNAADRQTDFVYTCGPLIHNPQILDLFFKKKVLVLNENIPKIGKGTVVIRAHGVPPHTEDKLLSAGYKLIDATCPRVARVQAIIETNALKGYATIIIGDRNHPEVVGLVGYAGLSVNVVCSISEIETLQVFEKAIVVAQTTQNIKFYQKVKKWIYKNNPHYIIYDTICDSTEKRQTEVKYLASHVDLIIVVGGKQSSNTERLREVAEAHCKSVFHIESESELFSYNMPLKVKSIGITAGASTPNWVIKRVYKTMKKLVLNNKHIQQI